MKLLEIEEKVRKYWLEKDIPSKWRRWEGGRPIFSFLEGPPTANGYPHVGHIRGRTYKDMVLRYYRLIGYNVWAQGGWDEQGLPVEVEVEKKLGIRRKKEISGKIGYERFIEECNNLVDYYLMYWKEYATWRLGLWLDLENAYETRKARYIEYVWKLIKEAYNKGLLYKGYRVLPFCPRCETALSDAEVNEGYRDKVSPSIYVKLKIKDMENTYLIIWTTTPWTLIDNEGVMVHPDGDYVKIDVGGEYWIIAKSLAEEVLNISKIHKYKIIDEFKGVILERLEYEHPLLEEAPLHKTHYNAHYVTLADFVSLEEGTGLVHSAPGHGPEDYEIGMKYGLPISSNVDINGVFNDDAGVFAGLDVDKASEKVIEILRRKGLLIYSGKITHSYPHCWRCGTPLIYRADSQWFIRAGELRSKFLDALRDVKIYPEKLRSRFENWLENAKDWTISRSRIWGTPLPIWRCKDDPSKILVLGSLEELKKYSYKLPDVDDDKLIHRPWIDMVKIRYDGCDEWIRELYVIDVWLDSGVAWIASIDGERNKELFSKLYPYSFITEAVDQTRGWFYSLHATSVLMKGIAPFKEILIQGHVLDKYGHKMSKHIGNVIWAVDMFNKKSVDAARVYILSKYAPGDPFNFDPDEIKDIVNMLNIIWNIFRFTYTYMELDKYDPNTQTLEKYEDELKIEDRWIISRVNSMLKKFIDHMGEYELHRATRELLDFLIEDVSRTYIRLVRPRVWIEEDNDNYVVYSTLYYVLIRSLKLLSTIAPHYSEELWQRFFKHFNPLLEESIHLSRLEEVDHSKIDVRLEEDMKRTLEIVSGISAARNKVGIKLRWPIKVAYVTGNNEHIKGLERFKGVAEFLSNTKNIQPVDSLDNIIREMELEVYDTDEFTVAIPKRLDKELFYEAIARELIRRIQVMRNEMDLNVDEYIEVGIESESEDILKTVELHKDYILNEVRGRSLSTNLVREGYVKKWSIEKYSVLISIKRYGDD